MTFDFAYKISLKWIACLFLYANCPEFATHITIGMKVCKTLIFMKFQTLNFWFPNFNFGTAPLQLSHSKEYPQMTL